MYLTEREYYESHEREPLVLIRKMRKLLRRDLRQGSASPQKCHTHFTGKMLWITYSRPCERVPWQPWQEGFSWCQLQPYHLGLVWAALLLTLSLPPTQGTLVGTIAIVYLPFCSWALAQTSCPHPPAQTCTWEVCFETAQLWICQFLSVLLVCLFVWNLASLGFKWKVKLCWQDGDCWALSWHGKGHMQGSRVNRKG